MRNAIITLVALAAGLALAKPPPGSTAPPADGGEHFADVNLLLHAPQGTNTPANTPAPAPPPPPAGGRKPLRGVNPPFQPTAGPHPPPHRPPPPPPGVCCRPRQS